ncbi:hypothetical protein ANANG_G00079800 [Anguilla anguilla]|uniref:XK-related protein n=1 Tax=Anguilla anguilla TaxID=7936 RepID=A0A9D3MPJ9_ANGAN|nr:hypothetical protein ANANG_G00079800 [Anguilla anguilla]
MLCVNTKFTKVRYLYLLVGFFLYMVDVGTDMWVAVQFYNSGHYAWFALTILFVLTGSLVPQIFSYVWLSDDRESEISFSGITRTQHIFLHVLQLGIFTRYCQLLKKGSSVFQKEYKREEDFEVFAMTTDLSMLRLFEMFLESAPQLLLQLYIILGCDHRSIVQYLCIAGSFLSIAWATVEYRRCFRRSSPHIKEMPSGLPTAVYLFYKLFTIGSRILSLSLLVVLNLYCISALLFLWLCGTLWAHKLQTDFCTSRCLEWFYRGIIGIILIFSFFNIKGQNARASMTVYYGLYTSQNLAFILLFYLLNPRAATSSYFLPVTLVIVGSQVAGLICLMVFYAFLNQRSEERTAQIADEVDGQEEKWTGPDNGMESCEKRMKAFMQH